MAEKTKRAKKNAEGWVIPAKVVAEIVECSASQVLKVRADTRSDETELGRLIKNTDLLLEQGSSALIAEVKRVVKFNQQSHE